MSLPDLEAKLQDEKAARQRAEAAKQDKEREVSMLSVDIRLVLVSSLSN